MANRKKAAKTSARKQREPVDTGASKLFVRRNAL
jgi:hypothetical protein